MNNAGTNVRKPVLEATEEEYGASHRRAGAPAPAATLRAAYEEQVHGLTVPSLLHSPAGTITATNMDSVYFLCKQAHKCVEPASRPSPAAALVTESEGVFLS